MKAKINLRRKSKQININRHRKTYNIPTNNLIISKNRKKLLPNIEKALELIPNKYSENERSEGSSEEEFGGFMNRIENEGLSGTGRKLEKCKINVENMLGHKTETYNAMPPPSLTLSNITQNKYYNSSRITGISMGKII